MSFNSKCPLCGSPAYTGFSSVECCKASCKNFKNPPKQKFFFVDAEGEVWQGNPVLEYPYLELLMEQMAKSYSRMMPPSGNRPVSEPRPMEQWE